MFLSNNHNNSKFDLFLLGEEEYYFSDESVVYYATSSAKGDSQRQIKGRMKICSQSLFFDPHEERLPIVRYAFQDITLIEPTGILYSNELFAIKTTKITQMRANMQNEPYKIEEGDIVHKFSLNYVSLTDFLSRVDRLYKISKHPRWIASEKIKEIVEEKEASSTFDTSWLEYLDERPLKEQHCVRVTPLVHNPGRLMITTKIVYFQPINNITANPVDKFPFNKIIRVIKRRHSLRHIGLEIFLEDDYQNLKSAFFAFRSEYIRNSVFQLLTNQPGMTKLQHENQAQTTLKWQCGLISNFDYLMYLNSLADRTFNDLTQYPVFPWIIADYKSEVLDLTIPNTFRDLSKPIGALNPQRLNYFKNRYYEMDPPKFLYGTHYSTPGYVLYYLVRVAPEYMLRLQNGKFDSPDRLFTDVGSTWDSVFNNSGDLKELIPEFFVPGGSFLLNSDDLRLGRKRDGTWVGDVVLPLWAKTPAEFIEKHRQALESDYVSQNLHLWIDLIFGYKQQGPNALASDNLFHPLTYEGAIDLDNIKDPIQKEALLVQINEFGQTPKQIFTNPHPPKFTKEIAQQYVTPRKDLSSSTGGTTTINRRLDLIEKDNETPSKESLMLDPLRGDIVVATTEDLNRHSGWLKINELTFNSSIKSHRSKISGLQLSSDSKTIFSVSHDSSLKIYDIQTARQLRSMKISQLALSSMGLVNNNKIVFIGSWDNNVYTYSVDYSRVVDTLYAHDDAVSSLCATDDLVVTSSWDSTVKVWKTRPSGIEKVPCADFVDHETEVKCVALNKDKSLVVSGGADGKIYYNDVRSATTIRQIHAHNKEITSLKFTEDGRLITAGADNCLKVFDAVGQEIFHVDVKETVWSVATNGERLVMGGDSGILRIWNLHPTEEITKLPPSPEKEPINCISINPNADVMLVGTESGCISYWTMPVHE